ncbi:hypothetical protein DPMN_154152 [Dreissena polymorpha]|uniref:Uncharacterized protein n=1 Tax=Dreissena polymorpha TaxID=45954 RepID=A0A9D4FMW9_DREPO|nr:hypothetical protein DPMN_154152 [Dreissena polymorpha]
MNDEHVFDDADNLRVVYVLDVDFDSCFATVTPVAAVQEHDCNGFNTFDMCINTCKRRPHNCAHPGLNFPPWK